MIIKCITEESAALVAEMKSMGFQACRDANEVTVYSDTLNVLNAIKERAVVFSLKGESLAEVVVGLLKKKGQTLAVSESLTGGLLSAEIVSVSGSSAVFKEGIVSYANSSKTARLGVESGVLSIVGAVSAEVAYQMAKGVLKGVDYSLSTTGIAGPNGDGICNVVGKTYIGIGDKNGVTTAEYVFTGDRQEIRKRAVYRALITLYEKINDR